MNENPIFARIEDMISTNDVFLFMKGSPAMPMCGFSGVVAKILNLQGVPFGSFNVLDDEDIRQGIKDYANWPTIPQVYVKGEFIGGCDILREMHESGELAELFADKGILKTDVA